jgi:hypothetical protein
MRADPLRSAADALAGIFAAVETDLMAKRVQETRAGRGCATQFQLECIGVADRR